MSLRNSHFKDTRFRIRVIDVIFIVFQHIFVNHFSFSLKIHSTTYISSFLLKRHHITVSAHHCFLILNTKPWSCSHCALTFSCDLRQLSQCRVQVQRVLLTLTICNFFSPSDFEWKLIISGKMPPQDLKAGIFIIQFQCIEDDHYLIVNHYVQSRLINLLLTSYHNQAAGFRKT